MCRDLIKCFKSGEMEQFQAAFSPVETLNQNYVRLLHVERLPFEWSFR